MKPLIVANWKMNPSTLKGANLLFNSVKRGLKDIKNTSPVGSRRLGVEVVICPPFVYLPILFEFLSRWTKSQIKLGAQDCFWEEKGAFTGEISPLMLKNLGVEYVILGHSERRNYLKETDEMINKKIKLALSFGLKVILCIGEKLSTRKKGKKALENFLKNQLFAGLNEIKEKDLKNIFIAYEPIWAIGSGRACPWEKAKEIRDFLKKAKNLPILYGGSVNSQNAEDFIKKAGFNGLLIGGASLNPSEFIKIIETLS